MKRSKTAGRKVRGSLQPLMSRTREALPRDAAGWGRCVLQGIIALYLACVLSFHGFYVLDPPALWLAALGVLVLTPAFFFGIRMLCIQFPHLGPSSILAQRKPLSWMVFAGVTCLVYALLLLALGAQYPGGVTFDNYRQWNEVQTGSFEDWHPAIHTMLIWLVTRILNRYAFFIAMQMLAFSLLAGYMAATLRAWGLKPLWVILFVGSLISARSTTGILLFAWKDSMFTVLALALAAQMVNIVLSKGAWLDSWLCRVAFAVPLALASLVRHNGIFFTVPLLLLVFFLFGRKRTWECFMCALVALVLVIGIKGPLYRLVQVSHDPDQGYVESVGLPMTILGSVYTTEPECLDEDIKAFLGSVATPQQWEDYFVFGSYNSIKWVVDANPIVAELPVTSLLSMTWRTICASPALSLKAALSLTQFVWDPNVWDYSVDWGITGDYGESVDNSITSQKENTNPERIERYLSVYTPLRSAINALTPGKLLQSVGINMVALALACGYSMRRRLGLRALLLLVPSFVYNLGTMLLLCGGDYRFFQFNSVITVPFVLVMLARTKEKQHK